MATTPELGEDAHEELTNYTGTSGDSPQDPSRNCLAHLRMLGYDPILSIPQITPEQVGVWKRPNENLRIYFDSVDKWKFYIIGQSYYENVKIGEHITKTLNNMQKVYEDAGHKIF